MKLVKATVSRIGADKGIGVAPRPIVDDSNESEAVEGGKILEVLNKILSAVTGLSFSKYKQDKAAISPVIVNSSMNNKRKAAPPRKPKAAKGATEGNLSKDDSPANNYIEKQSSTTEKTAGRVVNSSLSKIENSSKISTSKLERIGSNSDNNTRSSTENQSRSNSVFEVVATQSKLTEAKTSTSSNKSIALATKSIDRVMNSLGDSNKKELSTVPTTEKAQPSKERIRGEGGKFLSGSEAKEAQEKRREKAEKDAERSALADAIGGAINAASGGSATIDAISESTAADAIGTTVGGEDWKAGKEIYGAVKELRQGAATAKEGFESFKEKRAEKKATKAEIAERKKGSATKVGESSVKSNSFKKIFSLFTKKGRIEQKLHSESISDSANSQNKVFEESSEASSKKIVKAVEDNAGGSGGGSFFAGGSFKGVVGSLTKLVKVAGGPIAALLAGGSKFMDIKDDETLTTGQKTAQVVSTGGGAMAGALAGGAAGMAMGSVIPVVGTLIGGVLGSAIGGYLGASGGEVIGEVISDNMDGVASEVKAGSAGNKSNEVTSESKVIEAGDSIESNNQSHSTSNVESSKSEVITSARTSQSNNESTKVEAALIKTGRVSFDDVKRPNPIKLKPEADDATLNPNSVMGREKPTNSKGDSASADQISQPIVKAIEKLIKAGNKTNTRDAYKHTSIPTEFDSDLLTLMANDKL